MYWTFKKERHHTRTSERLFLCDADGETGYADFTECALVLGKLNTLFGEPTLSANFDDVYTYYVVAEAPGKEPVGLCIHEYNNAPSVDYPVGSEDAAKALADAINAAEPADYEYNIKFGEDFSMVTYFVKDGKAGSKSRTQTIMEIFDDTPSPEDIKQFTELGYELE